MSIGPTLDFVHDDLTGHEIRALIALHLERMHAHSPPESVHAFAMDQLRARDVTFWSAWLGGDLVGCGALKLLDARRGEIKSMRVADAYLGRGYGRAILYHLIGEGKGLALQSLWLETGSTPPFTPRCVSTRVPASCDADPSTLTWRTRSASS